MTTTQANGSGGDGLKITMVGAGGPTMVNDVVRTAGLRGARLVLHDVNAERLDRAYRFAAKLNAAGGAPIVLDRTIDPTAALEGADFVLASAEFDRFEHWRQDTRGPTGTAPVRSPARTVVRGRCSTRCARSRTRWASAPTSRGTAPTPC